MTLFTDWCDFSEEEDNRKRLWKLTEKEDGREQIKDTLHEVVRSHYDCLTRIAEDVERLGYGGAAAILRERLPRTKRARSGDLGEILATEFTERHLEFQVPIRRLRYKDGREMALRGDDFIGVTQDDDENLCLLKGESKSRKNLSEATVKKARKALNRDSGRPTPSSLLFVADRLLERGGADEVLGKKLRDEVANKAVPADRIAHAFFSLSGNAPPEAIEDDLADADDARAHEVINIHIADHADFIADVYEEAENLGDD